MYTPSHSKQEFVEVVLHHLFAPGEYARHLASVPKQSHGRESGENNLFPAPLLQWQSELESSL